MDEVARNRWRTRRMMAWIGVWYLVAELPVLGLLKYLGVDITSLTGVAISVGTAMAGIIMVYIGFSTKDDIANR